jgi:hypothetical protein
MRPNKRGQRLRNKRKTHCVMRSTTPRSPWDWRVTTVGHFVAISKTAQDKRKYAASSCQTILHIRQKLHGVSYLHSTDLRQISVLFDRQRDQDSVMVHDRPAAMAAGTRGQRRTAPGTNGAASETRKIDSARSPLPAFPSI